MKFKNIATFYVRLILDGVCVYSDVPRKLRPYVKEIAKELNVWDKISNGATDEYVD